METVVEPEAKPTQEEVGRWADGEIARLMGVINAATAELVGVVATAIEAEAWGGWGLRSPAHWLGWRAGLSPARAKGLVQVARRSSELPQVFGLFGRGALSEDALRAIAARTPPERDGEVAGLAQVLTVPQLRRVLGSLPKAEPKQPPAEDEPAPAPAPEPEERVGFGFDDDGTFWLRVVGMAPERGALVRTALEAARAAEFAARRPDAPAGAHPRGVTWGDAVERMALAALEALDPASGGGRAASGRYQVVVHLRSGPDGPHADLHLGPALPAAARRRLTCDTALRWVLEEKGTPVILGRKRRTVDPTLRTLIEDRDRGCRVPGCLQQRWVEVHHLLHVEDGGETVPQNLCSLCGPHHRAHHQGTLGISGDPTRPDGLVFTDRWGDPIEQRPPPTPPPRPLPAATPFEPPPGERLDWSYFSWN